MSKHKDYLGDAVYVEIDNAGDIVLTTEDGISVSNPIVLEYPVYRNLLEWLEWVEPVRQQKQSEVSDE